MTIAVYDLEDGVYLAVDRILEHDWHEQVCQTLALGHIHWSLHVQLVEAHHSIVHQLDEGLYLSDESFEEFLVLLVLKSSTLGILWAIIEWDQLLYWLLCVDDEGEHWLSEEIQDFYDRMLLDEQVLAESVKLCYVLGTGLDYCETNNIVLHHKLSTIYISSSRNSLQIARCHRVKKWGVRTLAVNHAWG